MNELSGPQERHAYWQQQVSIWKESGLSGDKFYKANDLSYHRFVYWRQKLGCSTAPKKTAPTASGFTRIAVQPEREMGCHCHCRCPVGLSCVVSLPLI